MSTLESRYRRLLAAYPRDHRAVHEDEMLGVLLATARPDQRSPGVRDTLDLLRGALLIRARRPWRLSAGPWSDGLAIVSLLGPVLLSAYAVIVGPPDGYDQLSTYTLGDRFPREYPLFVWVGWPLVLVAVVLGWRRLAVVAGWVAGLALPLQYWDWDLIVAFWFPLAALSAVALTWSPGPAHGLALVGWRRFTCYLVGVGLVDAAVAAVYELDLTPSHSWPTTVMLWSGTVVLVGAATDLASRAGRRAAVLLTLPAAWLAVWHALMTTPRVLATELYLAVPLVALAGVSIAVWVIERRQKTPDQPVEPDRDAHRAPKPAG